jgi:hypothetical protein
MNLTKRDDQILTFDAVNIIAIYLPYLMPKDSRRCTIQEEWGYQPTYICRCANTAELVISKRVGETLTKGDEEVVLYL